MKKLILLGLLIVLSYFGIEQVKSSDAIKNISFSETTISEGATYSGDLILINTNTPIIDIALPTDIVTLSTLETDFSFEQTVEMSEHILHPFSEMMKAAHEDGVDHFIVNSSFRDNIAQQQLYDTMAADLALPPGYSEHNAGLSIDIGSTNGQMEGSREAAWLEKNAAAYGFILRYPPNKSHITNIAHEPWHYRYVGLPHSHIIDKNNWTLEEYLAYLQKEKVINTTYKGLHYEVRYYKLEDSLQIQVPTSHPYNLSGDNMGGVIVTIEEG